MTAIDLERCIEHGVEADFRSEAPRRVGAEAIRDLREEGKCEIGAVDARKAPPAGWEVTLYQVLKAVYAALGWVVTTLALLTFSGVMRNRLAPD